MDVDAVVVVGSAVVDEFAAAVVELAGAGPPVPTDEDAVDGSALAESGSPHAASKTSAMMRVYG